MGNCESIVKTLNSKTTIFENDESYHKVENNNIKNFDNTYLVKTNNSTERNINFQNTNNNNVNPISNNNSSSILDNKPINPQQDSINKALNNNQEQEDNNKKSNRDLNINQIQEQNNQYAKKELQYNNQIQILNRDIQQLKCDQIKKYNENIQLNYRLSLLTKKLNEYNVNTQALKLQQTNSNNTIIQLQNQVNQLNTQIFMNQGLNSKIVAINKKNTQLQSQVNQLNAYKNKNQELNNTIIAINNNNVQLQNQVNQLSTQINKNQELNNTIFAINNKNAQLNQEILKLTSEIKYLKSLNSNEPILVGLDNIGATCYMNATLQSLSNTPKLTEYFLKKEQFDPTKIMSYQYYIVLKNLWDRKNHMKSYAPHSFKKVLSKENPLFEGVNANDSKDLINFLLERFHKELNTLNINNVQNNIQITQQDQLDEGKVLNLFIAEFNTKYHSIISDLFYGVMETKSKCQGCMNMKYNFQVYSFIEFPLEQVNKYYFNLGLKSNNTTINPDVDLFECFNYYGKIDLMNGDNQMYCNICRRNCDSLYSMSLYSLPNNLIINLNRGRGAVYQCTVKFPEKLNLLNFVSYQQGNTYFELYAVISHSGPSSMSGHFVAYCKHKTDKKWYKFNDSFVEPCKQKEEFRNGMPYILFYQAL